MHRISPIQSAIARLCAASFLGLAACTGTVWASHTGEELTADQGAVVSNDTLMRTLQQFETAPALQKSQRAAQLLQIASQRRARLLALLQKNPQIAAARFMPASVRDRLPAEAQAYVEREVRATGTVYATVSDDFARGRSKTEFHLHLNDNALQRLQLHMADGLGSERDMLGFVGRKLSLTGTQIDSQLVITDKRSVDMALDGINSAVTTVGTTAVVKGDQKTLAILVNYTDATLSCTQPDIQNRLFGTSGVTVNTNFQASSRGQVSWSGQAVGPFTIPYSKSSSCDYYGFAAAAESAAKAAGYDPANYARVHFVLPTNSTCGWGGIANMPGRRSWTQYCSYTGISAHEMGHNLSLHHAATPTSEYGDGSDPMGGAKNVLHNAANRVMAGWMPSGSVVNVTGGGSFALDALGLATWTSPQVLRIYKADTAEWYHVSLRQAMGMDASLPASYLNAVSITKSGTTLPYKTTLMAALAVGQSWSDGTNGITVTHQGLAGNTSTVAVAMTGATCTRAAPTVAVSPASQSGSPGVTRSYSLSIKNNDSSACGSSALSLAQALPGGFAGSLPASITVSPGATASATWSVTPSTTVGAGSYGVDVSAAGNGTSASTAHGSYSVVVDTTAPTVAISYPLNGSTISGRSATITATATDATSGVAKVEFYVDGALLGTDTSAPYSTSWQLRKVSKGVPHTVTVRAYDGAGNKAETSSSVVVN